MREFEMVQLAVWTKKKLAAANETVNQRLAEGWNVIGVTALNDSQSVLVALYRDRAAYR
ncbi:MAG: hypothetical protein LBL55_10055 [Propionibacteriaceae bacterium]|nr:hypothetical protein [Propionibacteriaceae bacterium]